jgi:hypothetical protein
MVVNFRSGVKANFSTRQHRRIGLDAESCWLREFRPPVFRAAVRCLQ